MFTYQKEATRNLPDFAIKGYSAYEPLLEALKKSYGGKGKLLVKLMDNLFWLSKKNNPMNSPTSRR